MFKPDTNSFLRANPTGQVHAGFGGFLIKQEQETAKDEDRNYNC